MRWDDFRQSDNVEDRRGDSSGPLAGPGFPLPTGRGGMGIGTIIILGLLSTIFGVVMMNEKYFRLNKIKS